ncbi:hypothetical protein VTK73DRAFT_7387 [Phialemonium thermophilum]|uniref:Uncharacterized protein n=1 Tax=Phialemonium thermophilum TaxID=223376 RepID=A0ABR3WEZ1_9PEZI
MQRPLLQASRRLVLLSSARTATSPLSQALARRNASTVRDSLLFRPANYAPADWWQPIKHVGRALQLYIPVAGMVLFWPFPVYKFAEFLV